MGADAAAVIQHRHGPREAWWWSASLYVPRDYHYFGVISGTRAITPDTPAWFKQLRYADDEPGFAWEEILDRVHDEESLKHLEHYECRPVVLSLAEAQKARFTVRASYKTIGPKPWWDGLIAMMEGIAMDNGGDENVRLLMGWDQG